MHGGTRAVALDISKAFDRIWHAGIFHKHRTCWFSGQIFSLNSLFLSNRQSCMVLNGPSSQESTINAEIPQRSIPGSNLFLLDINYLLDDIICYISAIFADDTALYSKYNWAFN